MHRSYQNAHLCAGDSGSKLCIYDTGVSSLLAGTTRLQRPGSISLASPQNSCLGTVRRQPTQCKPSMALCSVRCARALHCTLRLALVPIDLVLLLCFNFIVEHGTHFVHISCSARYYNPLPCCPHIDPLYRRSSCDGDKLFHLPDRSFVLTTTGNKNSKKVELQPIQEDTDRGPCLYLLRLSHSYPAICP